MVWYSHFIFDLETTYIRVKNELTNIPPPPLRKHQESQKNDGQTGSQCLDKAVLARDVRY